MYLKHGDNLFNPETKEVQSFEEVRQYDQSLTLLEGKRVKNQHIITVVNWTKYGYLLVIASVNKTEI